MTSFSPLSANIFFGALDFLKAHASKTKCAKFGAFVRSVTIFAKYSTNPLDYAALKVNCTFHTLSRGVKSI